MSDPPGCHALTDDPVMLQCLLKDHMKFSVTIFQTLPWSFHSVVADHWGCYLRWFLTTTQRLAVWFVVSGIRFFFYILPVEAFIIWTDDFLVAGFRLRGGGEVVWNPSWVLLSSESSGTASLPRQRQSQAWVVAGPSVVVSWKRAGWKGDRGWLRWLVRAPRCLENGRAGGGAPRVCRAAVNSNLVSWTRGGSVGPSPTRRPLIQRHAGLI